MGKRDEYYKTLEKSKESIIKQSNVVDDTIQQMQEKIDKQEPEIPASNKIVFEKKKELRSDRRTYAITPSITAKIKKVAHDNGVSENEVVCKILEQYFEES